MALLVVVLSQIVSNPKRESFHNEYAMRFWDWNIVSNPKRESFHNSIDPFPVDFSIVSNPKRESFHNCPVERL